MKSKPYILVKCAISIDGYIDDTSNERLILSDKTDFDRVDEERANCDAILLGADTIRNDNPSGLIKSEKRKAIRIKQGKPGDLIKITITSTGNLSKNLKYFNCGDNKKLVYCNQNSSKNLSIELGKLAEVIPVSDKIIDPEFILHDLYTRGIQKLIIEGGSKILTMFLTKGLVNELQVSIAPFFVGNNNGIKFVNNGDFIHNKNNRMKIKSSEILGDCVLLTYILK